MDDLPDIKVDVATPAPRVTFNIDTVLFVFVCLCSLTCLYLGYVLHVILELSNCNSKMFHL